MFGYNITTLIIILVIALLLFGPKRLPELGDSIGKAIKGFRKATEGEPETLPPSGEAPKTRDRESRLPHPPKFAPSARKTWEGNSSFVRIAAKKFSSPPVSSWS